MTVAGPFHERALARSESLLFKDWAGFFAVQSYDTCHEREYFALREAAGMIDVSPLFKYRVAGPDAVTLLDRVVTRHVAKAKVGRVLYTCWCDERGYVLDDGTVTRLAEQEFRLTSGAPNLAWLLAHAEGLDVTVEDVTESLAALSIQGPRSREVVVEALGDPALGKLRFFRHARSRLGDVEVDVSRTGYTGDLGYELWVPAEQAGALWDAVEQAGQRYRLLPAGLLAMDVARIEAGFVLLGVDYTSAREARIPRQFSTPAEIGLGRTVALAKPVPFVGQRALRQEAERGGPAERLVGLVVDWRGIEELFQTFDLPPQLPATAWRDGRPVYASRTGRQVGKATSGTWSPVLKQNLALATVDAPLSDPGQRLFLELTVEYERHRVPARVVELPFFDPPRKKSTAK